jgi:hypothetical protein
MFTPPHRIRSQRWVVYTPHPANALALRKHLHDCWQESVQPVFEKVFDEAVGREQIIHIPKIELQLQVANVEELIELLPELIQQQLNKYMPATLNGPSPSGEEALFWQEKNLQQSRFDDLLYYLRTGSLPWQAANAAPAETSIELKKTCRQQWSKLLEALRNNPEPASFYFRFFQLISNETTISLITVFVDTIPQAWASVMMQLITLLLVSGQGFFSRHTQLLLAATLLSESLRKRESSIAPDIVAIIERLVSQHEKYAYNNFVASLPDYVELANILEGQNQPALAGVTGKLTRQMPKTVVERPYSDLQVNLNSSALPDLTPSSKGNLIFDSTVLSHASGPAAEKECDNPYPRIDGEGNPFDTAYPFSNKRATDEFPLRVNHAGLILLNPYITRFFENTGINGAGNSLLSPFLTARAAALLHYLATGREVAYEYELGFIKILLGLNPEMALPVAEGLIKPDEREEAEVLLQSVIRHWSILQNTSVQGLRSSFLQRQGLLREDDKKWRLQVERESFDMLLDQLPWGISIVKLPWMPKPIYTEWSMT